VAIGAVFLIRLVYIGTPPAAGSLQFAGFVPLPKEPTPSVLGYPTISDYTTGKAGTLSVISREGPDSYYLVDNINLHYGAHTQSEA
jgi:hypothetical protein